MAAFGIRSTLPSLESAQAQLRSANLDGKAAPEKPDTFFGGHELRKHSLRKAKLKHPDAVIGEETYGRRAGRDGGKTYLTSLVSAEANRKKVAVDATALVRAIAPGNAPARDRHFGELTRWVELTQSLSKEADSNAEHIKALIPELAKDPDGQAKVLEKSYQIGLALKHMQQHGYTAETAWAQARTAAVPAPETVRMVKVPRSDRKQASPARQARPTPSQPEGVLPVSSQQADAQALKAARAAEVTRIAVVLCEKAPLLAKSPGLAERMSEHVIRSAEESGQHKDALISQACDGFHHWKFVARQGALFTVKGLGERDDAPFVKICEAWKKEQSDKDYAEGAQTVLQLFQTQGETPAFVKSATQATSLG